MKKSQEFLAVCLDLPIQLYFGFMNQDCWMCLSLIFHRSEEQRPVRTKSTMRNPLTSGSRAPVQPLTRGGQQGAMPPAHMAHLLPPPFCVGSQPSWKKWLTLNAQSYSCFPQ